MIDTILVQKLIEEEIDPDFTIAECYDTPLYIFIGWKHKEYYPDDERCCWLLGPGMVVYDKSKKEYRVMGSGESWHHDLLRSLVVKDPERKRQKDIMSNYFNDSLPSDEDRLWLINKIKKDILRRDRINTTDIDYLCIIAGARDPWNDENFDLARLPGLEREDHNLVTFDNKKAREELMQIWDELGFGYDIISETQLVLWKIKPAPNSGIANSGAGRNYNKQQ